jgi:hypothetical protein
MVSGVMFAGDWGLCEHNEGKGYVAGYSDVGE